MYAIYTDFLVQTTSFIACGLDSQHADLELPHSQHADSPVRDLNLANLGPWNCLNPVIRLGSVCAISAFDILRRAAVCPSGKMGISIIWIIGSFGCAGGISIAVEDVGSMGRFVSMFVVSNG